MALTVRAEINFGAVPPGTRTAAITTSAQLPGVQCTAWQVTPVQRDGCVRAASASGRSNTRRARQEANGTGADLTPDQITQLRAD